LRMWFGSMRGANCLNLRCYHCAAGAQDITQLMRSGAAVANG